MLKCKSVDGGCVCLLPKDHVEDHACYTCRGIWDHEHNDKTPDDRSNNQTDPDGNRVVKRPD